MRRPGGDSVLTQLAGVFDETPAQLRSRAGPPAAQAAGAVAMPLPAAAPQAAGSPQMAVNGAGSVPLAPAEPAEQQRQPEVSSAEAAAASMGAAIGAPAKGPAGAASELNRVREGSVEMDFGDDEEDSGGSPAPLAEGAEGDATVRPDIGPDCGPAIGVLPFPGPAKTAEEPPLLGTPKASSTWYCELKGLKWSAVPAGPDFGPSIGPTNGPSITDASPEAVQAAEDVPSPKGVPRHRVGPAMPSRELLEAAQEAAEAVRTASRTSEANVVCSSLHYLLLICCDAIGKLARCLADCHPDCEARHLGLSHSGVAGNAT